MAVVRLASYGVSRTRITKNRYTIKIFPFGDPSGVPFGGGGLTSYCFSDVLCANCQIKKNAFHHSAEGDHAIIVPCPTIMRSFVKINM